MKKALFLYYSQANQTERAMNTLAESFRGTMACDVVRFESEERFRFPWSMRGFFRAFPRCVRGEAPRPLPLNINWEDYELVVLGYQVWFLSPSLPIQGLLQSSEAEGLKGKPVICVLTCRNLWYSASKVMRTSLQKIGADFLGQITLCEISPLWASFVTTPRWMLTGRNNAFGIFPAAGVSEQDFSALTQRGRRLALSWSAGQGVGEGVLGSNLDRLSLRLMDRIGRRFFKIWAGVLAVVAPRAGVWQDCMLILFRLNLIALIVGVGPCTKVAELLVGSDSKKVKNY